MGATEGAVWQAPGRPIQEALFTLEGAVPEVPGLDVSLWRQVTPN